MIDKVYNEYGVLTDSAGGRHGVRMAYDYVQPLIGPVFGFRALSLLKARRS